MKLSDSIFSIITWIFSLTIAIAVFESGDNFISHLAGYLIFWLIIPLLQIIFEKYGFIEKEDLATKYSSKGLIVFLFLLGLVIFVFLIPAQSIK